jgi:hypothetical protein
MLAGGIPAAKDRSGLQHAAPAMDAGSSLSGRSSMRIGSGIILLFVLLSSAAFTNKSLAGTACPCTLEWESSPDSGVAGYALYYSVFGSLVTNRLDVGPATSATLKNLTAFASYYFYVVAYDANQVESGPSNLLPYTAPVVSLLELSQPSIGAVNLSFHVPVRAACHVEYTDTLTPPNWQVLTTATSDSNGLVAVSDPVVSGAGRFYRAVVP